ncbi:hypothetical protein M8C21_028107, partial [Ambrosia artemisiifolia]
MLLNIFRLGGQNYHSTGSLLPIEGEQPKFHQLYIYDTDNEVTNRHSLFRDKRNGYTKCSKTLDIAIIEDLKVMLDNNNQLVKTYRMSLPIASEVVALIVGDITQALGKRDIIVEKNNGFLKCISELQSSNLALQYPLLFPYGEDCYRIDIPHRKTENSETSKRQYLQCENFLHTMFKLDTFLKDLKDKAVLGKVQAVVYTVEFQKPSLPHAHICLFMDVDHKLPTVEHIEPFISVEIPDKKEDPALYTLVSEYMMHGLCGEANMKS